MFSWASPEGQVRTLRRDRDGNASASRQSDSVDCSGCEPRTIRVRASREQDVGRAREEMTKQARPGRSRGRSRESRGLLFSRQLLRGLAMLLFLPDQLLLVSLRAADEQVRLR